jgi:EAL domain-containing protein (putative c-di-GMP-specific phosphodiesterase class I)
VRRRTDAPALKHQPLVRLEDRRIVGAEALLRWTHPVRGPVSPAEFIPLAEESGLIAPIGEWILCEACERAASGAPFPATTTSS